MPTGSEIRQTFIRYFAEHGHRHVHSSSLVPANDPTLLFTNAGMNQFKDLFLGLEKRDYNRAATSQKCVRAGGKHNDLENVGFTKRHHTFFEMLGNFSFGDYFKRDAIHFAWELVTLKKWYGIDPGKLYVTIFEGAMEPHADIPRDVDAENYWMEVGVSKDRIFALGMKDNFWQMGDTGPCGPCSEIHYDMGPAASDEGHGVSSPECKFPCDCGRYVEIWNLVFMQFDRDSEGKLTPLPKPCVDTGMGLERVSCVLQDVLSNYDTDLFKPLIDRAAQLTGIDERKELAEEDQKKSGAASLRVIADHARATTFLISDGVIPSNEGRGYVLRKIMRRAIRHGRLLGYDKPFLFEMVYAVRDLMKDAYPELIDSADRVAEMVKGEERRFAKTLDIGLREFEALVEGPARNAKRILIREITAEAPALMKALPADYSRRSFDRADEEVFLRKASELVPLARLQKLKQDWANAARLRAVMIGGADAFKLYDTFGLPLDFIQEACRDQGIHFDEVGFNASLEMARNVARASWKGGAKQSASGVYVNVPQTYFEGYRTTRSMDCKILFVIQNGRSVQGIRNGEQADVILDHTPFYAESGGQVGDVGYFYASDHQTVVADVKGCYFPVQGVRAHRVVARGVLIPGNFVDAVVDEYVRSQTMRNHTGTHLLHAALRQVLGTHVKQAGSLVDPQHLRFDFSHFAQIEDEQMQDIEDLANREVLRNDKVEVIEDVPIDVAINEYKAMALFGEKYGERVRVIKIGDFSTELCGGTHTAATGEIGLLKVLHEGSVSAGVRRVEAVTGEGSLHHFRADHQLENVARNFVRPGEQHGSIAVALQREMEARDDEIRRLKKELDQARMKSAASVVQSIDKNVREVKGVKVLAHRSDNLDRPQMRTLVDNLRNKLGSGVVVLGSATDGKVALIVGVTKDLTAKVQAGKVVGAVAQKVGGKGGGRPDLAEAGGTDATALDSALEAAYDVVGSLLQ